MAGYGALLGFGLALSSPWWLLRMATTQRYREGLSQRLGRVPRALRAAVAGRRVVWLHAVSVGEVLAVSRLVRELQEALGAADGAGEPWVVVVSTTTRTGQALARERFGADRVFYFPLDLGVAVRAYLRALRPAMLVLAESEVWPRVLYECERAEIPVAVVNARMSDRSYRRALPFRRLWAPVLRRVGMWLAQSEEDARRLVEAGARADTVRVSGNLKYDIRAPQGSRLPALLAAVRGDRPMLVAGSTAGRGSGGERSEEEAVLAAWRGQLQTEEEVLLVLAPRHPERFGEVAELVRGLRSVRATELLARAPEESRRTGEGRERIECVVLDTIGDLAAVYEVADVAFVGGSLLPTGGHNPLEPAQFGVPVIMGRSYENFRDIVARMRAADGIRIVGDGDALRVAVLELVGNPEMARSLGERGREVYDREGGATGRTLAALLPRLREGAASLGGEVRA